MGVFADLLSNAKSFKSTSPIGRYLTSIINRQLDPAIPAAAAATDAVHDIAQATQTGGNCTLTITLRNGESFTTGNIAYDDNAATVEGAIDTAATSASITGWTNGDISVSGTAMNNADNLVLTFDGDSVKETIHPITVLTDVDGSGGAWGAVSITTPGQGARYAFGAMIALGLLDGGTVPDQTATPASNSAFAAGSADRLAKFPQDAINELAQEVGFEDDNTDNYYSLMYSLGINVSQVFKSEPLGTSSLI